MVIILLDIIKTTCPYCKFDLYIIDDREIYHLNRINSFLHECDFCKNTFRGHYDGEKLVTMRIHKDKRKNVSKGDETMLDKNTIFETVYNTIKYNMDWGFGCDNDKFTHFVNGIIAMAEGLIDKIEPKTENTEK